MPPYNNHYTTPESITRPATLNPGGLCSIIYFKWQDVDQWPIIDPLTGIIADSVILKDGAEFYTINPTENERKFTEELKYDQAGPFHEIIVNTRLGGNTNNATITLGILQHHQFGLIIKDRNGDQRLIGDSSSGAKIIYDYTSGDFSENRGRNIKWQWKNPMPAPIYHSGGISQVPPGCTQYTYIDRFRVGAVGAPMVDGDTTYTNALLINSNFILFADDRYVPQVTDNPLQRYATKLYTSDTITINGGVYGPPSVPEGEIIEIYKAL